MNPKIKCATSLVMGALLCSGCSIKPQKDRVTDQPVPTIGAASEAEIHRNFLSGGAHEGEQLVAEYYSASGKHCKRYDSVQGSQPRVQCRSEAGEWSSAKKVEGLYANDVPMLAAASDEHMHNDTDEANGMITMSRALKSQVVQTEIASSSDVVSSDNSVVEFFVNHGENLWRFSKRTTGTGTNWQAIAAENNLDNPEQIGSGARLYVPSHLVIQE